MILSAQAFIIRAIKVESETKFLGFQLRFCKAN